MVRTGGPRTDCAYTNERREHGGVAATAQGLSLSFVFATEMELEAEVKPIYFALYGKEGNIQLALVHIAGKNKKLLVTCCNGKIYAKKNNFTAEWCFGTTRNLAEGVFVSHLASDETWPTGPFFFFFCESFLLLLCLAYHT